MNSLISPLFLLQGAGITFVVVCAVWWWQRGRPSVWPAVWWGVLAWTLSTALKIAAALPSMSFIQHHSKNPLIWLYGGLLTGVFECAIPLWLIAKTRLRDADWSRAVAFGIGFGGIEAFLMGIVGLAQSVMLVMFPNQIPASVRDALLKSFAGHSLASIPLPIIERVTAMVAHCLACVLLIYAVRMRQQRCFWLSFAYKTVIDGFAAWAVLAWGLNGSIAKAVEFEAMLSIFVLMAVVALPKLRAGFNRLEERQGSPTPLDYASGDGACWNGARLETHLPK